MVLHIKRDLRLIYKMRLGGVVLLDFQLDGGLVREGEGE